MRPKSCSSNAQGEVAGSNNGNSVRGGEGARRCAAWARGRSPTVVALEARLRPGGRSGGGVVESGGDAAPTRWLAARGRLETRRLVACGVEA